MTRQLRRLARWEGEFIKQPGMEKGTGPSIPDGVVEGKDHVNMETTLSGLRIYHCNDFPRGPVGNIRPQLVVAVLQDVEKTGIQVLGVFSRNFHALKVVFKIERMYWSEESL